jgi:hypothetical protein
MNHIQTTRQAGPRRRLASVIAAATTLAAVGGLALADINLGSGPADAAQSNQAANTAAAQPDNFKSKDPDVWKVEPGPFQADGKQAYTVQARVPRLTNGFCDMSPFDHKIHFRVKQPGKKWYTVKVEPGASSQANECIAQISVASTVPGTTVVKAWQLSFFHRSYLRGEADLQFVPTHG